MARGGTALFVVLLGLPLSLACATATPLGVMSWEEYEDRAGGTPLPAAPPPPGADGLVDLTLRELGATGTSGDDVPGRRESGISPLRTDATFGIRPSRWLGVRLFGGVGYGAPLGVHPRGLSLPTTATGEVAAAISVGWWGEARWSIHLEIETHVVILTSADRYQGVSGPCARIDGLFGSHVECTPTTFSGVFTTHDRLAAAPALGGTLDVAGLPLSWLRIGGSASVQQLVTRDRDGGMQHEPVGIARLFVEAYVDDLHVGLEAQQWVVENVTFAPMLGLWVSGVVGDRSVSPPAAAPEPDPLDAIPDEMAWPGDGSPPAPVGELAERAWERRTGGRVRREPWWRHTDATGVAP